jgi:iron complex outermembrane receptor protein
LNDANSVAADAYHVLGCRLGWKPVLKGNVVLNFYTGVDNLLSETYSLGNDINASAGVIIILPPKGIIMQVFHSNGINRQQNIRNKNFIR